MTIRRSEYFAHVAKCVARDRAREKPPPQPGERYYDYIRRTCRTHARHFREMHEEIRKFNPKKEPNDAQHSNAQPEA